MKESDLFPIVETAQGKLRGLNSGGVHVFKGVRYGADTSGANRFRPPQPVRPWPGVRDATAYGHYAPQMPIDKRRAYADLIAYDLQPGGMGEDCLVLNLWTPRSPSAAGKPVMVHLHGGGWYGGSGNSPQFDGESMARFGEVVFISINHRLGAFGFMHLGGLCGERHARSGMSGMLDIVAALRWVHENVAAFGGDPSRVLVFGQSGGGAKTSVLMAMPSAQGLFHRAGVMSGSALRVAAEDTAHLASLAMLKELAIDANAPDLIDKLQALPYPQLLAAQVTLEMTDRLKGEAPRSFMPVVDGEALPRHPFDPDAPAVSAEVPMIVGSVLDERAYRNVRFDLDEAGLQRFAKERLGDDADRLLALYRAEDPSATPYLLQVRIDTDSSFRKAAHLQIERKAAQGRAPVWTYLWTIPSPAYGGRYGAVHGVDIGPSLHDIRHGLNGPSAESLRLADQLASAWVSFAATGDPNNAMTPAWDAYTLKERRTLLFAGDSSRTATVSDPRAAFRSYWAGQ